MSDRLGTFYSKEFYKERDDGSSQSAIVILQLLFKYYKPRTVVDIGCGQGSWLAAAEAMGCTELKGIDGAWVEKDQIKSKNIEFQVVNFTENIPELNKKYDLCMCLEVAEHLPESMSRSFIDFLCSASDVVLFSAAVKGQGGRNHINEQWQSYWINLFHFNDYTCLDFIRGAVWNNPLVEWWYRQNTFVFLRPDHPLNASSKLLNVNNSIANVVHPDLYEQKMGYFRSLIDS